MFVSSSMPLHAPHTSAPTFTLSALFAAAGIAGAMLTASPAAFAQPLAPPNAGPGVVARFDGHPVVRVPVNSAADVARMFTYSDDPWFCGPVKTGWADFRVSPEQHARMVADGVAHEVIIPNVQALIDAENARIRDALNAPGNGVELPQGPAFFSDYQTYAAISSYVDSLVTQRPTMARRITLGNSLQGNAIFAIVISSPNSSATKPAIFFHSLQHAREWITGSTTMYIADAMLNRYGTDARITRALDSFQFIIVPVMNPDGYLWTWSNNRLWRKNRRGDVTGVWGVDLNRNWSVGFGGQGSSGSRTNETFRGPSAFSEPETQVLRDFVTARPFIRAYLDIHSFSQLILSPWGYTNTLPPQADLFNDLNAVLQRNIASVNGLTYTAGPTFTTIYPASGTASDWAFGGPGVLGWGMELRDTGANGFVLPPSNIVPQGEEMLSGILGLADAINTPIRFSFPSAVPSSATAGSTVTIDVVISSMAGTLDPASPTLRLRSGTLGDLSSTPMQNLGNGRYRATFSAGPCSSALQFGFEARTTAGTLTRSPALLAGQVNAGGSASADQFTLFSLSASGACTPCPADFNGDGIVNTDDLSDYITVYFTQPPVPGPGGDAVPCASSGAPATGYQADFNRDCLLNTDDLSDYITAYFSGC